MSGKVPELEPLDQEWKELILSALEMGITSEEIRSYLQSFSAANEKMPQLVK
ncbi:anti-repressor SinI family protein [Metabacillus sp. GX 13764]|uniref:anti-repressor SinI family protein n=1 Tax=Metabacillus kandeliae TaxID=2900151 RepID=UPI001E5CF1D3|nr:anti-repressor SinI family protein [Metabacillus kandeliae]MCD7033175.1 anti-repressor SinI family protein [Metabacillus kandeliae]